MTSHSHPDATTTVRQVSAALEVLGPDHVVLTTDVFSRWVPPQPEMLRVFAEQLVFLGWSAGDLRRMLVTNPHAALGVAGPDGDRG